MRRLAFLLLLSSCGAEAPRDPANGVVAPDNRVECRAEGEAAFARNCSVDTFDSDDGRLLTIRKADGGFRRLRVTTDGSGVVAADGAERTHVTLLADGRIEVEIGGDRFRLPARVRAQ
jgi:hypothetical protein